MIVEKEIPSTKEKNQKGARLREAVRFLQELPLERLPTSEEWDSATRDLSQDDLDRLKVLAQGHLDRALQLLESDRLEDVEDEARAAILLNPREKAWLEEVSKSLQTKKWISPEATAFRLILNIRTGRKRTKKFPFWGWIIVVTMVVTPLAIWAVYAMGTELKLIAPDNRVIGPRKLEAAFDTQGIKTNIQVAQSRLILFPDATVAELSAWVTFPDHRVDVWEGAVEVLDSEGNQLTRREITFRSSSQDPIEAGQGVEVFQQFDAWPWFDRVASFRLETTRILAQETHPKDRKEMPVTGLEELSPGYNIRVWLQKSEWVDRFASKVHNLSLELENTGLKPFEELQFILLWRDETGRTLKTLSFRPVSPFRTALPSGGRLGWNQETIFDTEVFDWLPGNEPIPVLELRKWQ